jgi:hypothetical protein
MLDQHERHARVNGQMGQELRECFQPTGGSADADDGKLTCRQRSFIARLVRLGGRMELVLFVVTCPQFMYQLL